MAATMPSKKQEKGGCVLVFEKVLDGIGVSFVNVQELCHTKLTSSSPLNCAVLQHGNAFCLFPTKLLCNLRSLLAVLSFWVVN